MTREITFDRAPDLRRTFAAALVTGRGATAELPDARAVRTAVRVELDHLVDYARFCGFTVGGTLPLTYPHLLAFPLQMVLMSRRAFPLPLLGAVHLENTITATRPISPAEQFDLAVWAEHLRPHPKGRQVDLLSEARVDGAVVWREVSTYLARGSAHPDAPGSQAPSLEPLDGVTTGPVWRVAEGVGRGYAAVSGDWNPIHLHTLTARPLGFPSAIAHGMYTYARAVASLGPKLPEAGVSSRVWFRKPVRLPSTVRLRSAFDSRRVLSVLERTKDGLEHAVIEHAW